MDEFKKRLRGMQPWKRKRCGPFKLSELPLAAVKKLYEAGRVVVGNRRINSLNPSRQFINRFV
jgi:hypothetical protein